MSLVPGRTAGRPAGTYFAGQRTDLLGWYGGRCTRVLEVGCGAGGNAGWLRANGAQRLVGIDVDAASIRAAAHEFDLAINDTVEAALPKLKESFDLIVCADVLEHLIDPTAVLGELASRLDPGGHVVASIPNIRHYRNLARIAFGKGFAPEREGPFDATHLRFFTKSNIAAMLVAAGLEPVRWGASPPRRLARVRRAVSRGPVAEYLTFQWFVEAGPGLAADRA